MPKKGSGIPSDFLNVMGDHADLDERTIALLEQGRHERVQILDGTDRPGEARTPCARVRLY